MEPMTNLTLKHENILLTILREYFHHLPLSVFVFGSRAGASPRTDSDLDLLIDSAEEIPLSTIAKLKEALEDSDLPFRVDIVLRTDVSPEFYQRIRGDLTLLYRSNVKPT
jgi:predicted nucleotidyltransferase